MTKSRAILALLAATAVAVTFAVMVDTSDDGTSSQAGPTPPFEPVTIQRIDLPPNLNEASSPVFSRDGHHVLFFADQQLWIVADDGNHPSCLSCGLDNRPTLSPSEQEGFATPFPDGQRVFFGAADSVAVLECLPSVDDCLRRQVLPVDLSGARPNGGGAGAGGVDGQPAIDLGGGVAPKLAPDGNHVAFSDIRSDVAEMMVIATLTRTDAKYVTSDPHVLNPAPPSSPTDTDPTPWSQSSGLFEFKSFADGGADATYSRSAVPA
jgi:hypothetical protein